MGGVCNAKDQQKIIQSNQLDDVLEYCGYEEFPQTDFLNRNKQQGQSMFNNPGGSSVGQNESSPEKQKPKGEKKPNQSLENRQPTEQENVKLRSIKTDNKLEEKKEGSYNPDNMNNSNQNQKESCDQNKISEIKPAEDIKTEEKKIEINIDQPKITEPEKEILRAPKTNNENINNQNNNIDNGNNLGQNIQYQNDLIPNPIQEEPQQHQTNEVTVENYVQKSNGNNNQIDTNAGPEDNDIDGQKIKLPKPFELISKHVLENGDGTEILFVTLLKKMVHLSYKERVKYMERLCAVTRENFFIYDNKDDYKSFKSPSAIIPLSSIEKIVLFKLTEKTLQYNHFYVEFKIDENTSLAYDRINTFFINDNKSVDNQKNETALIMLKAEEPGLAKKWYVVLNYLIGRKKQTENL